MAPFPFISSYLLLFKLYLQSDQTEKQRDTKEMVEESRQSWLQPLEQMGENNKKEISKRSNLSFNKNKQV